MDLPSQENDLTWLFLDLNSYFASVEQQERPSLREKPVAVTPMETDYTCAIAASYEAKAYGVKTGMGIKEARKICPGLRCVLARHDVYVSYHHKIINEIIRHIPINKICSIDELSSRLPPRLRNREAITALSARIKDGIHRNVGEAINCSIGAAPNAFLAKIATDMMKPDGLVILSKESLPGPLFDLKLTDLPGINVNMERRLFRAGITTVEQFWNLSPKHARKIWGSLLGERFWYNLHGFDMNEPESKTSVIGHSRVLDPTLRAIDPARQVTRRLTIKAAGRLRRKQFYATRFSLSVRSDDQKRWGSEAQIPPSQDNFAFLKALGELWEIMQGNLAPRRLKKVSVSLSGLCKQEEITPDLFDTNSESYQELKQQNEALSSVIDRLNAKYGAETVQIGPSPRTRAGHVGTKIAFSRIPDQSEFHE